MDRQLRLLSGHEFSAILNCLACNISKVTLRRETCVDVKGYFRVVAVLHCGSAEPVDDFHNSCSGYRAQYLQSTDSGDSANALSVSVLADLVRDRIEARAPPHWCKDWALKSVNHRSAKVWIHQGLWLWHAKESCDDLLVDAWVDGRSSADAKVRKRARYGRQLPGEERRVDFKGAWVTPQLKVHESLKPCRALSIHRCGFT